LLLELPGGIGGMDCIEITFFGGTAQHIVPLEVEFYPDDDYRPG
jgi:hypothetical protein